MLTLKSLETGYGKKQILFGVSISVELGEIVAIIGPNGSGKSTTLKAIYGLTPIWNGEVVFNNKRLNGLHPAQMTTCRLAFAPQGSRVFNELTVLENLRIGGHHLSPVRFKQRTETVLDIFPALRERTYHKAGKLSGGQQQMLAIARALIPNPQFLMLDEPSLGLAPTVLSMLFEKIVEINQIFGTTILVVEQRVREVLEICDRVYSLKLGKVSFEGSPKELQENQQKLKELFF
ncbi:ABC transporter ATP-binding protein [Scytonema hofmannii PCC 7110]|uniref:ABC transporter ATP-binding protein n=1 Tax=Scytonema hofmannii PCC 7110 TaxID=128403 RepID=A0A139X905_9CYAN|nr:ABC transporter ATP-binding protein [Scytonema hofmannii]KYC41191.1 ABC transporter ATP-binding protein [Scytonema hofmannii PCC 7110]